MRQQGVMKRLIGLNRRGKAIVSNIEIQKIFANLPQIVSRLPRLTECVQSAVYQFDTASSMIGEYFSMALGLVNRLD